LLKDKSTTVDDTCRMDRTGYVRYAVCGRDRLVDDVLAEAGPGGSGREWIQLTVLAEVEDILPSTVCDRGSGSG